MMDKSIIIQYVAYNVWANRLITDWIASFSDEAFDRELVSSFSTVRKTILHICNGHYVWFQRISGMPLTDIPSEVFQGDKAAVLELFMSTSVQWSDLMNNLSEEELMSTRTYPNFNGLESMMVVHMIHTTMNHSTYHRGQLVTMGRQLGYDNPPKTDFVQYIREIQKDLNQH
jgi:uncharacterized damage-inducible protein DinB